MSAPRTARTTGDNRSPRRGRLFRRLVVAFLILFAGALVVTRFGGHLLVAPDPLPEHADAAIVLGGGDASTMARFGEAVRLLEEGRVDHVMLMVGTIYRWGEWMPDVVRRYIARELGDKTARAIIVCEGLADSTIEEAAVLQSCLRETDWESLIIVTSDFHTRRSKLIWRAALDRGSADTSMTVHGVADGGFELRGWWRHRDYAKTWLLETTKLGWYFVESMHPGRW